ncbi:hypothetical protein [Streptomyces sp. C3-3]|uniref:hypothetical protein n=1 Tax=Streptomyces sp. C3-3 TaxID=2824901 RepID=UPI001B36C1D6|nr:hypothetical protein [Streptomyces sp. C3-3]MBQ1112715.1 hypothetical protein [Streptomyces sp. C3-3]
MNAAEYRAAAEHILSKDTLSWGDITPDSFRKAEILAQLAVSASISEASETRTAPQLTEARGEEPAMDMDAYEQRQADLNQMHADYEAIDAAEYAQFNDEMDARDAKRT